MTNQAEAKDSPPIRREVEVVGRSRITSKGQMTIPKAVRDRMSIGPGDEVEFVLDDDGRIRVRRDPRALREAIEKWGGAIHDPDLDAVDVDEWLDEVRGR